MEESTSNSTIVKDNLSNVGLERVMGYYRNFDNFNIGKKQEFRDRVWFEEKLAFDNQKMRAA